MLPPYTQSKSNHTPEEIVLLFCPIYGRTIYFPEASSNLIVGISRNPFLKGFSHETGSTTNIYLIYRKAQRKSYIYIFHLRRYSPFWALASLTRRLHSSLSFLVFSILVFLGPVKCPSGRRLPILFLVFPLLLCVCMCMPDK